MSSIMSFRLLVVASCLIATSLCSGEEPRQRPNIVFFFADDWGRNAGCYADPTKPSPSDVVKTPHIDQVAAEGVRFNNAYYDCPQCAPSRAAIVSGCYFWRCGSNAFLRGGEWKNQDDPYSHLPNFPTLLKENGYATAKAVKTLDFNPTLKVSPGEFKRYGLYLSEAKTAAERDQRRQEVIDQTRATIRTVLTDCPKEKPFFFVFGPINTHRPFAPGSGQALWGINPDTLKGKLPVYLPDVPEVRTDYADYLGEVQALDLMIGIFLEELEKAQQTANTLLVLTGDNGVPGFPRGKTQLYDLGSRAPLIVKWPGHIKPGRTVDDLVTLKDLAATFLDVAHVKQPELMDARSLLPQLISEQNGIIDPQRTTSIYGRERHAPSARAENLPYPSRAIHSADFVYIRNPKPDRFPFGDPPGPNASPIQPAKIGEDGESATKGFADMDDSLTKKWLSDHQFDPVGKPFYELAFGKRVEEELYNLRNDPDQMHNLADSPEYAAVKKQLSEQLSSVMETTKDPRVNDAFDRFPYIEQKSKGKDKTKPTNQ